MFKGLSCAFGILGAALILSAAPSLAATYDKPVRVTVSASPALGQIRCTYYSDFMVLETGTDEPGPGPAELRPGSPASLPCTDEKTSRGLTFATGGLTYAGRRSGFLIFTATDPNGAIPFLILNERGRLLYSDSLLDQGAGEDFQTVDSLPGGGLHLRFVRGINASCSLLTDASCWSGLGRNGSLPRAVSRLTAPTAACEASYARGKSPPGDPSIVSYEVDISLSEAGKPHVNSRGALGCEPLP